MAKADPIATCTAPGMAHVAPADGNICGRCGSALSLADLKAARLWGNTKRPVIVHVNQHVIKHNAKHDTKLPTLTVKHPVTGTFYCHEVHGIGTVVDHNAQGREPLSCGARVWIEYPVWSFEVRGPTMTFPELSAGMSLDTASVV